MLAHGIKQTTAGAAAGANLTLAAVTGFPTFAAKYSTGTNGDPIPLAVIRNSDGVGVMWALGHLVDTSTLAIDKVVATWDGTTLNENTPTAIDLSSGGPFTVQVSDLAALRAVVIQGSSPLLNATQRFIMPGQWCGNPASGIGATAGTAIATPFRLDSDIKCSGISFKVNTGATTGTTKNLRASLYRPDINGGIGNLVAEGLSVSAATAAVVKSSFAANVHLTPGWYFVIVLADGNPVLAGTNSMGIAGIYPGWGCSGGDPGGRVISVTRAMTYVDSGSCFPSSFYTTGLTHNVDWGALSPCPSLVAVS